MKLVVGLGNPGPRYADTRHNVGARVVERFGADHHLPCAETRFSGRFGIGRMGPLDVALLLPSTAMNRSGEAVCAALGQLPVTEPSRDLLLVYDELDLPVGRLRVRPTGGAGGHRGMADVIRCIERRDFPRMRFGIGRPPEDVDPVEYVLAPFPTTDREFVEERVAAGAQAIEVVLLEGVVAAMNRFNREPDTDCGSDELELGKGLE